MVRVDINETVVNMINRGQIHIEESGLNTLVKAAVNSKNLVTAVKPEEAEIFIIAVPTSITDDKKGGFKLCHKCC